MEAGKEGRKNSRKMNPFNGRKAQQNALMEFRGYQAHPALLPLPFAPPMFVLIPPYPALLPHFAFPRTKPHFQNSFRHFSEFDPPLLPISQDMELVRQKPSVLPMKETRVLDTSTMATARRPDRGGKEGSSVSLLANHFLVQFDPKQRIFHYDVDISPRTSKEIARKIKAKLVKENSDVLAGAMPVFDGRKNLYSSVEFQNDKIEFFVSLPILRSESFIKEVDINPLTSPKSKLFRVTIRLASKLSGEDLNNYLNDEGEEKNIPLLPQDYLHALDIVLRESPSENCFSSGRSMYSSSMGGATDLGGGAVGLRGFFQSLRPTQQGLALNLDFSVTAFHESISVIAYLQKHCNSLKDLSETKGRCLGEDERREVEKALKNIRIFVCHRETDQRYRVYSLTAEVTENLKFKDRDGSFLSVVEYYKDHYNYEIQFKGLPCLQINRTRPCFLPMELCMVCDGQKFLGKLSDDQTARIFKMGCRRPDERRDIIDRIIRGEHGPTSGFYAKEFKLNISREMTQLRGRVLQPPKLKLGDRGHVRDLTPSRHDRQFNLSDSHVAEGSQIKRWALISFGGSPEQRSGIPAFITQLSNRCQHIGVMLSKNTISPPFFEPVKALNDVSAIDSKLRRAYDAASGNLQLMVIVMEKKHRGYSDLKRIAETSIGVVSQCCLYSNIGKPTSQFLSNMALKLNAKLGGCNVALFNTIPRQYPRIFADDVPAMFMGADVTHPHPLDDSSPSIAAVVASMNWPAVNRYVATMRSQTHRREIIEELEQMTLELLEDFIAAVGRLPGRIIFFRDGVSETQFQRVLKDELKAIRAACSKFAGYTPAITFTVVQKRHHTRLFVNEHSGGRTAGGGDNVPPGTVVDTVITHPREFDFYLCSHWGMKGTSRPTHYHVLWDENKFGSDEFQNLIHDLCYTFVRCTKPVSLVPPAYYAHLAAYRGRLYLERSDSNRASKTNAVFRNGPPRTEPLPKVRDCVKRLMFYC